jgi:hypothetical protein
MENNMTTNPITCYYENESCKVSPDPNSEHGHFAVRVNGDFAEYFSTDLALCIRHADKRAKELEEKKNANLPQGFKIHTYRKFNFR